MIANQRELNFNPGDEFLYSNSGYWLLGQIVNKVAGMNMADFAKKEIFEPLNMTSTYFQNNHNQIVKNRASGYIPTDDESYQISMTTLDMIGDGGIFTTINDIKKWDDAYYDRSVLSNEFWTSLSRWLTLSCSINYWITGSYPVIRGLLSSNFPLLDKLKVSTTFSLWINLSNFGIR